MELENLSITNVCGGAVDEVFQRELAHLLENIADPNTNAEAPRSLTLEFKVKPFKDRTAAQIELVVKSKTAGMSSVAGTMYLQRRGAQLVAMNHDPRQARLFAPASDPKTEVKSN